MSFTFIQQSPFSLNEKEINGIHTACKVSKYGAFSSPYFPVFGLNTGKHGLEKTQCLDNFHAVSLKCSL